MDEIHQLEISSAFSPLLSRAFFFFFFLLSNPPYLPSHFLVLFSFITSTFPLHHPVIHSPPNLFLILLSSISNHSPPLVSTQALTSSPVILLYSSYLFLILLSAPRSSPLILFSSLPTKSSLLLNRHVAISSSLPDNPVFSLSI